MDFVRSCYKRPIRYVAGDTSIKATATWYVAKKGALAFPFSHAFGSQNWDIVHPTVTALGDVATTKAVYYNGRRLNRSDGQTFAGPADYFLHGCPAPSFLPRALDGTPIECLPAPFGKAGGGLCLTVSPAIGLKKGGGFCIDGSYTLTCPAVPLSINALMTAGAGPPAVHVGSNITLTWNGFNWVGGIGAGADRINFVGSCSSGVLSILVLFFIIPATPTLTTNLLPVNFSGTATAGGDSGTFTFT